MVSFFGHFNQHIQRNEEFLSHFLRMYMEMLAEQNYKTYHQSKVAVFLYLTHPSSQVLFNLFDGVETHGIIPLAQGTFVQ